MQRLLVSMTALGLMAMGLMAMGLMGCAGADLPAGWEDAKHVEGLTQSACGGSPYEDFDERVEGDISGSPLVVAYREAHFRCEQEVEAFYRVVDADVEVLVQPVDMNPSAVAGCDCLYDVDFQIRLEEDLAPTELVLFRRWDEAGGPTEPIEVGRLERE